jgi:hypothetical protein
MGRSQHPKYKTYFDTEILQTHHATSSLPKLALSLPAPVERSGPGSKGGKGGEIGFMAKAEFAGYNSKDTHIFIVPDWWELSVT